VEEGSPVDVAKSYMRSSPFAEKYPFWEITIYWHASLQGWNTLSNP